jgi:predicted permease
MRTTEKHKSIRDTIGYGAGHGFLYGMFLPAGLMEIGKDANLAVTMLIFIGSPFLCMIVMWFVYRLGVKLFGRPVMEFANVAQLMIMFAIVGGVAGYYIGRSVVAGVFGAFGLAVPNAALFYSRREFLFGESSESESE